MLFLGTDGTWSRTYHKQTFAAHGGLPCSDADTGEEIPDGHTETGGCNRHRCGCSHVHCEFDGGKDSASAISVRHFSPKNYGSQLPGLAEREEKGTVHHCHLIDKTHHTCACLCAHRNSGFATHPHIRFFANVNGDYSFMHQSSSGHKALAIYSTHFIPHTSIHANDSIHQGGVPGEY